MGASLKIMCLKLELGRDPAINIGFWAKNDGAVMSQMALGHFVYVHVLWR